jgi:hypothetical protein
MTALSVPLPTTYRETSDRFSSILVGAPDFEFLQRCATYTITLEMMMDSLRSGIATVAGRTRNPKALALFQQCREEVDATHELYRENKIPEARQRIQVAARLFEQAGKLRNKKDSDRLVEEDQP